MIPSAQVKLEPPEQLPCEGVTVPRVKPADHVSASDTACASEGPALCTVIVYVWTTASPAVTSVTPSDLVTDRFAEVFTTSESVAVLLVPSGSSVVELTVAVLSCGLAVVEAGTV